MSQERIPMAVCAAVASVLRGSHATLEALFTAVGIPGPAPTLPHGEKWKLWLYQAGTNPDVDRFAVLGGLLEEFMDTPADLLTHSPGWGETAEDVKIAWKLKRQAIDGLLREHGLQYFRGGRVMPIGMSRPNSVVDLLRDEAKPANLNDLLRLLIRGVPRAMYPLTHRRKNAACLSFVTEWDIQDLLHALLRPWVQDIRAEEFTPSYAGTTTRMDFLLPAHKTVIETKRVRDKTHGREVAHEIVIDIEHYLKHPDCNHLWVAVFDTQSFIANPSGFVSDLSGPRIVSGRSVSVEVVYVGQ